ncbi:M43 family zinc metalloprotease [Rubrivirga sp.]|uniref:M43 family zinc metalloprotease n=1 Tax=Rubrivirga sp. TaxID=1885344 RepID=UPI003C785FA9
MTHAPSTLSSVRALVAVALVVSLSAAAVSCDNVSDPEPPPSLHDGVYRIAVVVHVVHHGEPVGVGHNLSLARIEGQIEGLNDDYRRREGTRGFNTHPDGADARVEFVLARTAPDGTATTGIVRVNATEVDNPVEGNGLFDRFAFYGYWPPEHYLNVWTMPLPPSTVDVVLGLATGPETDLPGADHLLVGEPFQAEGVLVNSAHFGASSLDSEYNLGRTLTHEVGHYLGLLHPWGGGNCDANDHCLDTPAQSTPLTGCPSPAPTGCSGQPVMVENYMNWTADRCMSTFTADQVSRMHHVLEHSPRRRTLANSPGLAAPDSAIASTR